VSIDTLLSRFAGVKQTRDAGPSLGAGDVVLFFSTSQRPRHNAKESTMLYLVIAKSRTRKRLQIGRAYEPHRLYSPGRSLGPPLRFAPRSEGKGLPLRMLTGLPLPDCRAAVGAQLHAA
jgi:hypothetical protein